LAGILQLVEATHVKGAIALDSLTWDKVIGGDRAVLVKFDKDYAYGEKEDHFKSLAEMVGRGSDEVIVAMVGVQEYGDKLNEDLVEKYGINKSLFPVYKLFPRRNEGPPVAYTGEIRQDDLVRFLMNQIGGLYIALPGCIRELDTIAARFMASSRAGRANQEELAARIIHKLQTQAEKDNGSFYMLVMSRIQDRGDGFVVTETARLNKMLESASITEVRKAAFRTKLNILPSFKPNRQEL